MCFIKNLSHKSKKKVGKARDPVDGCRPLKKIIDPPLEKNKSVKHFDIYETGMGSMDAAKGLRFLKNPLL